MKKVVFRLIALSFSASLIGCQATRQNEKTWQQIGNARPFFKNEKTLLPKGNGSNDNRISKNNRSNTSLGKNDNGKTKPKN
ncbi:MAG: hypothetical protein ACR2L1_03660 [Pyrinomonadaceae bacterium]